MTTTTDSLAGLIYHAAEHLDPQHQTPCWPDPIGWDGRPLAEQATDLCVLLDARAADGDDRADELAEDLRRTVAQLQF